LPSGTESKPFLIIRGQTAKFTKQAIALEALLFIKSSYPATDAELVSKEFAKEIFTRKDWSIQEVKNFFRFIKDNAHVKEFKVLGNFIGLMNLMGFIILYEQKRSEARESKHQSYKNLEPTTPLPVPKEHIEKILKTVKSAMVKPVYTGKPPVIHNAFDPIKSEPDFITFQELITYSTYEEKAQWRKTIYAFDSIDEKEMERREKLLTLLPKPETEIK